MVRWKQIDITEHPSQRPSRNPSPSHVAVVLPTHNDFMFRGCMSGTLTLLLS